MEKFSFSFYIFSEAHSKRSSYTCRANDSTENNLVEVRCKSGFSINQAKDDGEEDYEVPAEITRLLEHEEKEIQPQKRANRSDQSGFQ